MSLEAMKQALEALEVAANGGGVNFYEYAKDLRQAIAEAEKQEPVAWYDSESGWTDFHSFKPARKPSSPSAKWLPLYTHAQPKREWVGLDKDEFKFIASKYLLNREVGLEYFQEELEAKLKEKNT